MMSKKAKAFMTLWKMGRVNKDALLQAAKKGLLTVEEVELIVGE